MSKLKVNRDRDISLIEESWWTGDLDGKSVDIHTLVYRCYLGQMCGQFGASSHICSGGKVMINGGGPKPEKLCWADSRDEAVQMALVALEARDDLR